METKGEQGIFRRLRLLITVGPLVLGCGGETSDRDVFILVDDARDSVASYVYDSSNHEVRFGWEANPTTSEPFHHLWTGRVVEDRIVFADIEPPVLRVYDVSGTQIWTAAPEGRGPGEANRPRDLAVSPRGRVGLLHDQNRLSVFDASGDFLVAHTFDGIPPTAVGADCDGQGWLIYGPTETGNGRPVPWLRRIRWQDERPEIDTLWSSEAPASRPPYRDWHQLSRVGDGIELDHPYRPEGGLLRWNCTDRRMETRSTTTYRSSAPTTRSETGANGRRIATVGLRTDVPYPRGRARVGNVVLRTFGLPYHPNFNGSATYLRATRGTQTIQVLLSGTYNLLDSWSDGRLLVRRSSAGGNEAFVLDGHRLVELLVDGSTRASRVQADDTLFFRTFPP